MSARIFRQPRSAMQSGAAATRVWLLTFAPAQAREVEPLMGWTSSGDMKQQITLRFATREEAVAYAERNGIAHMVEPEQLPARRHIVYSDNFRPGRIGLWTH